MSPWNYVAIAAGIVGLCWLAGVFISIAQNDEDQAEADKEELLRKANEEANQRPRVRAGTTQLPSLHRTHYEP